MKNFSFLLAFFAAALLVMTGCKKVEPLPYYNNGSQVTLTASKTSLVPTVADSTNKILALNWTSPNYGEAPSAYKFVIEIDSSGRNFSRAIRREVIGKQTDSLTGRDLNAILLNNGLAIGTAYNLDIRVLSSYGNNNERYTSNTVKVAVTPFNDPSVLSGSATSVTATLPTAGNDALTFSWSPSFKGYSGAVTYSLQVDSAGKNFSFPQEVQVGSNVFNKTLTQADVNTEAINAGVIGGSTGKIDYRVKAQTAQGAISYSSPVSITVTTFVPVPDNLYIVGDATPGGWSNPVATPSQQFSKVDAYSFSITIPLTSGKSYLFLPVNGSWDHKYGGATDGTAASGGVILKDNAVPGSNTPAPGTSGLYKIVVNFQTNKYTVTPYDGPDNLYIVGDATPGGWDNPVQVPAQQFTKISDGVFGIVTNLTSGKSYLFLPVNGSWDHKYGGGTDGTANSGTLLADGAVPGSNTPAPAATGLYKIIVDFSANKYTVTPYSGPSNLYIVGDATPGGWSNPVATPSQQFSKVSEAEFEITLPLTSGKSYLFLPVNGSWDHKYGGGTDGTANSGTLLADGAVPGSNTPAPGVDGTYKINVSFLTNTYKVTKQ